MCCMNTVQDKLLASARRLSKRASGLDFGETVAYCYNPLDYAWKGYASYVSKWASAPCRILFVGMNPGPWGMAQTGVPFGEIEATRDWLGIYELINGPARMHPKRPIEGFGTSRSEVSGKRLWSLFQERFGTPERFFKDHFVTNYCPLAFMADTARNITPDKLPAARVSALYKACDDHLRETVELLQVDWVIGIGCFAETRIQAALPQGPCIGRLLHPSPASPAANRGWAPQAIRQMEEMHLW